MMTLRIPKTEIRPPKRVIMTLDADDVKVMLEAIKAYRLDLQTLREQNLTNYQLWNMQKDMDCIDRIENYLKCSDI